MKVIAAVGRNASGKDTLAGYLQQRCDVPVLVAGDVVRNLARERGIEPTRANLHKLSRQIMREHGQDYLMRCLIDRVEAHDWQAIAISGVRTPVDVETLRERFGQDLLVVHVAVGDPRERYRRMQDRDAPRDPESYAAFLRQEREEEKLFSLSETIRRADMTIENNGVLEAFHRQIEAALIRPLLAEEVACEMPSQPK